MRLHTRPLVADHEIAVTDLEHGAVKVYINPLGKPFLPIQDTSAFATCP